MRRWLKIGLFVATLGVTGALLYALQVANPQIVEELRHNPCGGRSDIVMLLHLPDGRVLPVNYLREGAQVFAGADGPWWRAFRAGNVPVRLEIRGAVLAGRARVVLDDPEYTKAIFARLRPTVPPWLPEWLNGYLVVVELDHASAGLTVCSDTTESAA